MFIAVSMSIKISVIIPTYNRAHFLCETVKSVFAQSFEDYEIIVVDDGSTDETREAIKVFSDKPNFRYYFQENKGRSTARNLGTEKAFGEYLMFLDSDDTLEPQALETLYDVARKYTESEVVGGRYRWFEDQGKVYDLGYQWLEREAFSEYLFVEKIRQFFLCQGSYIIRKELVQRIGGFPVSLEAGEDIQFFCSYCDAAKISVISDVIVNVRRHHGNTSKEDTDRSIIEVSQQMFERTQANLFRHSDEMLLNEKIEWQFKIADYFYGLGDNSNAFRHYLMAVKIKPSLIFNLKVLKLILLTVVPGGIKEKAKTVFRDKQVF